MSLPDPIQKPAVGWGFEQRTIRLLLLVMAICAKTNQPWRFGEVGDPNARSHHHGQRDHAQEAAGERPRGETAGDAQHHEAGARDDQQVLARGILEAQFCFFVMGAGGREPN